MSGKFMKIKRVVLLLLTIQLCGCGAKSQEVISEKIESQEPIATISESSVASESVEQIQEEVAESTEPSEPTDNGDLTLEELMTKNPEDLTEDERAILEVLQSMETFSASDIVNNADGTYSYSENLMNYVMGRAPYNNYTTDEVKTFLDTIAYDLRISGTSLMKSKLDRVTEEDIETALIIAKPDGTHTNTSGTNTSAGNGGGGSSSSSNGGSSSSFSNSNLEDSFVTPETNIPTTDPLPDETTLVPNIGGDGGEIVGPIIEFN